MKLQREARKIKGTIPNHLSFGWDVCDPNHDRRRHNEDILLACVREDLHPKPSHNHRVLFGVHRHSHFVGSASELEFNSRSFSFCSHHCHRLLCANMGGIPSQRQIHSHVLRATRWRIRGHKDSQRLECTWHYCLRFQRSQSCARNIGTKLHKIKCLCSSRNPLCSHLLEPFTSVELFPSIQMSSFVGNYAFRCKAALILGHVERR